MYQTADDATNPSALRAIEGEGRGLYDDVYRSAEDQYFKDVLRDDSAQYVNAANNDFYQQMYNNQVPPSAYGGAHRSTNQGSALAGARNQAQLSADTNRAAGITDAANLGLGFMKDSQQSFGAQATANNQMMIQKANINNSLRDAQMDSAMTGLGSAYQGWQIKKNRDWANRRNGTDIDYNINRGITSSPVVPKNQGWLW